MSDNECIEITLGGDLSAFSFLVRKYQNMVFSIVNKIANNKEDSEDIAQDVFIKAFKALSTFKATSKFSTWLYSIAYNEAITFTKKNKQTFISLENNLVETEKEDCYDLKYSENMVAKLKQELECLKKDEALIINLFYFLNNSIEEIAEITDSSISNIKVKLFRIRKKLYIKLSNDDNK